MTDECQHTITQGRKGERGSWCCACGVQVYDVEDRQCQDCAHSRNGFVGMTCHKHLMAITPDMNVTFNITEGTCFSEKTKSELDT